MFLYIASFLILVFAELVGILRDLYVIKHHKFAVSTLNSFSCMLWCLKIVVVVDNPYTIITAGLGGFVGSYLAFFLHNKYQKS